MSKQPKDLEEILAPLRDVPKRDSKAAQRGRAQFLADAAQLRTQHESPRWWERLRESLLFWWWDVQRPLATTFASLLFLLIGAWSLILASQNSVAGDALYAVKRGWQQTQLAVTFDPVLEMDLRLEFLNEHVRESEMLLDANRLTDFYTTQDYFVQQTEMLLQAFQQLNTVQEAQLTAVLTLQADLIQQTLPQSAWGVHPIGIEQGHLVWLGEVTDKQDTSWQLNNQLMVMITPATIIEDPTLRLGDWVEVVLQENQEAIVIRRWRAETLLPPQVTETITGLVVRLTAELIQVGETTALVDVNTEMEGTVVEGGMAELTAVRSLDKYVAQRVVGLTPTATPTLQATETPQPTQTVLPVATQLLPTNPVVPTVLVTNIPPPIQNTLPPTVAHTQTATPTPTEEALPTATAQPLPTDNLNTPTPTASPLPPVPTNTPQATVTPNPPTTTPTATTRPPTATPNPPTATPTATTRPPTATPVPTEEPVLFTIEGFIESFGTNFVVVNGTSFVRTEETVVTGGNLEVGAFVLVLAQETGTGATVALVIEVLENGNEPVQMTGRVTNYTNDSITLDSSFTAIIDDFTNVVGQPFVGANVYLEAIPNGAGWFATYIEVYEEANEEIVITGILEVIRDNELVIGGETIYLTEQTVIDGSLEVGGMFLALVLSETYEIIAIQRLDIPNE